MDVIFTVSPKYLHAVRKEIHPFSFGVQGYSDLARARAGIYNTSFSKIMGFMFVGDSVSDFDSTELKKFLEFISKILDGDDRKPIVFVLKSSSGLEKFNKCGVTIMSTNSFDLMTDVPIKNGIGYILKYIRPPYINDKEETIPVKHEPNPLTLEYPFEQLYLEVTRSVFIYRNLEDTLSHDIVLNKIKDSGNIIYQLRESFIFASHGVIKDVPLESYRGTMSQYLILKVISSYIHDYSLEHHDLRGVQLETLIN